MSTELPEREVESGRPQDPISALIAPVGLPVAIAFILITLFTFYEVVMRYVFNAPTFWVHETTTAMTALCFAFGGAYCLALDRHIRVVLIYDALPPVARKWIDVLISLLGTIACALMSWAAWSLAYKAFYTPTGDFRLERTGSDWNPPTPAIVKTTLFIILCLMCAQFALQTVRNIRRKPSDDDRAPANEAPPADV